MEIDFSHKNCTFKLQINFDRHNAGLKFNYCLRFDLPNFSLPLKQDWGEEGMLQGHKDGVRGQKSERPLGLWT
jgi:hypothetical protein